MRRLTVLLVTVGLVMTLMVPAAMATGPVVSLLLDKSSAAVGDKVVLTVSAADVADLYGSSIDLFYDPALLEPSADSESTTAAGLVTQGISPSQYFTSILSGTSGSLNRITLIGLRLRQQPGASGSGTVGQVEFTAKAAGSTTFALTTGNPTPGSGVVAVNFISSTGDAIGFGLGASQTLTVGAAPSLTIESPAPGAILGSGSVTVSGTTGADASVSVTLDSSSTLSAIANAAGAYSVTFNSVGEGSHSVVATVGSVSTSAVSFVVDTVNPQVTIDPVANPAASITITGTYTEQNIDKVYVQVNSTGSPAAADLATLNTTNHTYSKSVSLTVGSNLIRTTATDVAGHSGTAELTVNYASTLPYLHLVFDKTTYAPGDTVYVDAIMENIPANLGAISGEFEYDSTRLSFADLSFASSILGSTGKQFVVIADDPAPGVVLVNITNPNGITAGITRAFQMQFTVKDSAADGNAAISFHEITPGATGGNGTLFLDRSLATIPDGDPISGAAGISRGGQLVGTFRLVGRAGNPPDYSGITVTVMSGSTSVASGTTAGDGSISIGAIPPGTYTVRLTKRPYLTLDVTNVPITSATTTSLTAMNLAMLPGNITDTSSTDAVFLEDLGALATAWGATSTAQNWNAYADLDGNGSVFLADLGLLATYWGKTGATRSGSTQIFPYSAQ